MWKFIRNVIGILLLPLLYVVLVVFSIAIVALMNFAFLLVTIAVLLGDYSLLTSFVQASITRSQEVYSALLDRAKNLDLSVLTGLLNR